MMIIFNNVGLFLVWWPLSRAVSLPRLGWHSFTYRAAPGSADPLGTTKNRNVWLLSRGKGDSEPTEAVVKTSTHIDALPRHARVSPRLGLMKAARGGFLA